MRRISRGLLAAVLAVSVAAAARSADVDPLLPKETEQVVHVNVKQILESDIVKTYALGQIKQAMQGEDVKKQLEALGLDPLKDVEKLTVGFWGKDQSDMNAVVVLRGKFDPKKIFESAKAEAAKSPDKLSIEDEGDAKLVKIANDSGKPFFLTVADDKVVIGGTDKKLVAAALDGFNKKEKAKLGKELTALVLKQDDKASMYFCGVVEGKIDADKIPDDAFNQLKAFGIDGEAMKKQISAMSTVAMTLRLGKEVAMDITMGMKDEDTAEEFGGKKGSLTKLIETGKQFLPLLGGQQPKAKGLIDDVSKTLTSKVKGKDVTLSVAVTADAIGSAVGKDE
jgi:hypothetical protein